MKKNGSGRGNFEIEDIWEDQGHSIYLSKGLRYLKVLQIRGEKGERKETRQAGTEFCSAVPCKSLEVATPKGPSCCPGKIR